MGGFDRIEATVKETATDDDEGRRKVCQRNRASSLARVVRGQCAATGETAEVVDKNGFVSWSPLCRVEVTAHKVFVRK